MSPHTHSRYWLRRAAVVALFTGALAAPMGASAATQEQLEAQLQSIVQQLEAVKAELAQLKAAQQAQLQNQAPVPAAASGPAVAATAESNRSPLSFFGYGEIGYSRPEGDAASTTADVGRFVIGVGYQFDEHTRLNSELEIEHAVSSASDPGEVEVEQAYIDHEFSPGVFAKAGLFLIPSGLLNENHEPTRYYGVFRNQVETAIIPTTWREGGLAVQGNLASGLRWDAGVTTGFDLSKWDATATEGQESPLGSVHQELALARAKDLSWFGALNYTGVTGLRLGASLFTGAAGQGQTGFDGTRVRLWEVHARWTPGPLDLAALYARGHISGTQAVNTTLVGNISP